MPILKIHRKPTPLQEKILLKISRHGFSKSLLQKELGNHYSDISDAVEILKDRKLISRRSEKKGRGKNEIFYGLTDSGVKYLINQEYFSKKDFWRMLFFIFDTSTQHNLKLTENKLLEDYIKNKLKITSSTSFYFHCLENFSSSISDEQRHRCLEVLKLFGLKGKINLITILNKFSKTEHDTTLYLLAENNFLYFYKTQNKNYFELSEFGFLYLLNFLKNKSNNFEEINEIINNHKRLFPRIFKEWNGLLRENEISVLLRILTRLYFEPLQLSIDDLNVSYSLKLRNALLDMEISKREQMLDFIKNADAVLNEWVENKETKLSAWDLTPEIANKEFPSIEKLLKKIIQIQKTRPLSMAVQINGGYFSDEEYPGYENERRQISKDIKEIVSFQFFSLLQFNTSKQSWNKISKKPKFQKWFSEWLDEIIKDKQENLEILKKDILKIKF